MTAKIDGKEKQPICSTCADELRAGGFKVTFGKDAWLHMDKCSVCGRRLPVHDGTISGRGRRRRKKIKSDFSGPAGKCQERYT